jgi:hypothetical protein
MSKRTAARSLLSPLGGPDAKRQVGGHSYAVDAPQWPAIS